MERPQSPTWPIELVGRLIHACEGRRRNDIVSIFFQAVHFLMTANMFASKVHLAPSLHPTISPPSSLLLFSSTSTSSPPPLSPLSSAPPSSTTLHHQYTMPHHQSPIPHLEWLTTDDSYHAVMIVQSAVIMWSFGGFLDEICDSDTLPHYVSKSLSRFVGWMSQAPPKNPPWIL